MIEKTVIDSYNKIKRLPVEELEKLWYAFFEDKTNKKLRDQLIVQYIYLTKYVIGRIKGNLPPSFSIDDIAGYGVEGLIDAILPTKVQDLKPTRLCVSEGQSLTKSERRIGCPEAPERKLKTLKKQRKNYVRNSADPQLPQKSAKFWELKKKMQY